jgi:hypothetical protein
MPIGCTLPYVNHRQKVLQPKPKARTRTLDLSREKRRANAAIAEQKRTQLWEDLQNFWKTQDAFAEEMAEKHGKLKKWMKDAVQRVAKYRRTQRAISPHNALIHAKSLEINPGMCLRLHDET